MNKYSAQPGGILRVASLCVIHQSLALSLTLLFFFFGIVLCRARITSRPSVIAKSDDLAGGQTDRAASEARRTRLWEGAWRAARVRWAGGEEVGGSCRGRCSSITASPGWGSRCKALIAPRSLSLLCGRPLRSCRPPPRLQRGRASGERGGRDCQPAMLLHCAVIARNYSVAFLCIQRHFKNVTGKEAF